MKAAGWGKKGERQRTHRTLSPDYAAPTLTPRVALPSFLTMGAPWNLVSAICLGVAAVLFIVACATNWPARPSPPQYLSKFFPDFRFSTCLVRLLRAAQLVPLFGTPHTIPPSTSSFVRDSFRIPSFRDFWSRGRGPPHAPPTSPPLHLALCQRPRGLAPASPSTPSFSPGLSPNLFIVSGVLYI